MDSNDLDRKAHPTVEERTAHERSATGPGAPRSVATELDIDVRGILRLALFILGLVVLYVAAAAI